MKANLVGILKKGEMKYLFDKHDNDALCNEDVFNLEPVPRSSYVVLFRLESNHLECHPLEGILEWFSRGKTQLPKSRGTVSNADIERVMKFIYTIQPPPPPESGREIPVDYNRNHQFIDGFVSRRRRRRN